LDVVVDFGEWNDHFSRRILRPRRGETIVRPQGSGGPRSTCPTLERVVTSCSLPEDSISGLHHLLALKEEYVPKE